MYTSSSTDATPEVILETLLTHNFITNEEIRPVGELLNMMASQEDPYDTIQEIIKILESKSTVSTSQERDGFWALTQKTYIHIYMRRPNDIQMIVKIAKGVYPCPESN